VCRGGGGGHLTLCQYTESGGAYRVNVAHILVGADFHDAPLSFLEAGEARSDDLRSQLAGRSDLLTGHIVVATCHRLEVYAEVKDLYPALDAIVECLADTLGQSAAVTGRIFRVLYESSVTRHLFSVTSGLEAMVVGETEIAGQVKRSVDRAAEMGTLTPGLRRLFDRAIVVSKRVHTDVGINESGRSLIDAAIDAASPHLPPMPAVRALLIGTGAYARVVRASLTRRGVSTISVYSSSGRADNFAAVHGLQAVDRDGLMNALGDVDLVVSASGQSGHVITRDIAVGTLAHRPGQALTFIDLALARDIDPLVGSVDGCQVVALDDLKDASHQENRRVVWEAERLVDDLARQFADAERSRTIDPVVVALRENIARLVEEEIDRVRRRHGDDVASRVEHSLHRVTRALIHTPTLRGRDLAVAGQEDDYVKAIRTLFDVEAPVNG
jgi:glutamyl-tRNA reductase